MAKSGWCAGVKVPHHKCMPGPWSNGARCECICHSGSEEGNRLIDEAREREQARAAWEAEQQALLDQVNDEEPEEPVEIKPKTKRRKKAA